MDISIKTPEVAAVDLSAALRSEKEAARNSDAAYLSWSLALATDKRRDVELVAAVKAATKNNLGFSIAASSRNRDGIVGAILSRPGDTDDFVFPESLEKRWRVPETDPHTDGPLLRDGKIVYRPLTVSWDFRASADQWSVPRVVRALLEPDNNRSVKGQTAVGKKVLLAEINACESQSQALSVIFSRYAKMVEAAKAAAKAKTEESEETSEESEKSTEETPARTLTEYLQAMAGVINAAASAEITDPAAAIVLLDGHIATLNKIREAAQAKAVTPVAE